jgi:hypothetical protein
MSSTQPTPENFFYDYSKLSKKEYFEMLKEEQESERAGMDEFYSDPSNFMDVLARTAATTIVENDDPFSKPDRVTPLEGALHTIGLRIPVAPVAANAKYPPIPNFQNLATTDESQILAWAQEKPNCNWLALAKSDGFLLLDKDDVAALHSLYRARYGEDWPLAYRTRSQANHEQEYWKQTDRTRAFGNRVQGAFMNRLLSFRQNDLYCMAEGSHLEPSKENGPAPRDYELADASAIREMPDRLMDFIESLLVAKEKKNRTRKRLPEMYINGRPVEAAPPDPGFKKLFDAVGWKPLQDRLNKHVDTRFHDFTVGEREANTFCPIPSHGPQDVTMPYRACFGVVAGEPGLLHCFGCDWTGDMVSACHAVDGDDSRNMYDVARAVCGENNLRFEDYFPPLSKPAVDPAAAAVPATTVPQEWGEPEPFDSFLLPVLPFQSDYLPQSLRPWTQDVSQRMSVPLDFPAICLLVGLAGVVNRRAFMYPKEFDKSWKEAIAISGSIVAESGKTKTPTWKTVVINMIEELAGDWREEYETLMAKYNQSLQNWEKAQKENEKNKVKGGSNIETPPPVEPPPLRTLIINDATPEKLHEVMQDNPEGVLVFRDELTGLISELDREGREAQREIILCAMNGNDHFAVSRIGRGNIHAIMCASIFGSFQPDLLRAFLGDKRNVSDGLFARFGLFAWPNDAKIPIHDLAVDENAKQRVKRIIRILATMIAEDVNLHFSPEAQPLFNAWLQKHADKTEAEEQEGIKAHLNKYKGLMPKLCALYHLIDLVSATGVAPKGSYTVGPEHVAQVIRFLAYLESHVRRAYASARGPLEQVEAELVRRLQNGDLKDGFTGRQIQRKWGRDYLADWIEQALENREEAGWVRQIPRPEQAGRGRPASRAWEINPRIRA